RQESAVGRMIDELDHAIPEAIDVQQTEGFGVIAERIPAPCLEQFIQRSDAAWKRKESIREIGHLRLALMHGVDRVKLGDSRVSDFEVHQRSWDDAVDLAARLEHAVGDQSHQPEPASAIDEVDTALDH